MDEALERLKEDIEQGIIHDRDSLARRKREVSAAFHLERMPSNSEILAHVGGHADFLRRKPVRTLSGVAVIAVMSRPAPCPHGTCVYCPGGPTADVPQSYTGHEPAAMRAIQNRYHPFLQVYKRIEQLHSIGHPTDKVELIIMGGTFPSQDLDYQEYFVRECLSAMNLFDPSVPAAAVEAALFGAGEASEQETDRGRRILSRRPLLIEDAQRRNERASNRCVGMTFETRPDWSRRPHIDRMLSYGGTRVELGVQTVYDFIYARVKRGHTTRDTIEATALLKDQGFKINYHVMPGLPGSDKERDLRMVERIVSDPDYRPDMMKFYTCLVMEGTPLHDDYLSGDYVPYSTEETVDLLVRAKSLLPPWIRTMRIQRDIPTTRIAAGVMRSNMGQMVEDEMHRRGISCRCIRCREIGLQSYKRGLEPRREDVQLVTRTYAASGGTEVFLSYEDMRSDTLIGFLRLRIPGEHVFRREITERSALLRELHVYGPLASLGTKAAELPWWQHQGYGKKLLFEAERVAQEDYDADKMVVISGIGVRDYYRTHGYRKEGPYVTKLLS
jgi:elongator complex protein 3